MNANKYQKLAMRTNDGKASDRLTVEEYNLQPLEVDANAFALLAMSSMFGIMPQFQNLSDSVRESIKSRADQMKAELE